MASAATTFKKGRDFAAWLGLTPKQNSTRGKQKPGATSTMGERTLRRLLIIIACAVVRHARRRGHSPRIVAGADALRQAVWRKAGSTKTWSRRHSRPARGRRGYRKVKGR
ncbi:transposase [Bradyrhizobium sp. ISRA443]|uniref:transposase n=1 Tax=unclassified Bradyrhizobium TaxID=2631580 RepID=UPI00247A4E0F|nr:MULTISPECIES: transposase [unclassified Bradyrhizobium]WGS02804.1 transposase [Bradyrhizobium sp. ISRA436]WGS09690.1 transposase [Bradyrhizobium sp. ISRA437]WGS16574.1 transposase [Bradyrhizobium sp. ISRA443]